MTNFEQETNFNVMKTFPKVTGLYLTTLCLLLFLAACGGHHSPNSKEQKRNPIIADNISNHHINAFAEDSKGHIWIGTFRGLNKFDGHQDRKSTRLNSSH